jgi:1-acyl-sn-glycerol-3-phosphate acyltransferase
MSTSRSLPQRRRLDGDQPARVAARSALADLRREIRARFPSEVRAEQRRAPRWENSFEELRERFARLGMRERSGQIDDFGMDEAALALARPLLDFLYDRYWRVDADGSDALPASGPCLLVANHSGLLPYDAVMLGHAVERARGTRPHFAVADWLIALPFAQARLAKLGGVRACPENVERLLGERRFVAVFPEGVKGAAKAYRNRYRLARFGRGGVVRIALECGVPLVPVGIVGAEEAHPILYKAPGALGLPFVPVTPTFPWLGPLGMLPLPAQWVIRFGEAIDYTDVGREAARDELLLSRLTEELRDRIQSLVDAGLRARGSLWSLAAGQASAGAPSDRTG